MAVKKNKDDPLTTTLNSEIELLERHLKILHTVVRMSPIGVIRLSKVTGIKDYRVRYSLRMLEREGLIKPTQDGAVYTPQAKKILPELKKTCRHLGKRLTNLVDKLEAERKKL